MQAASKTSVVILDGHRIAFSRSEGTGPTLLFVHGNSSSRASFDGFMHGPLGKKYRVIALDLPGHGDSSRIEDGKSYSVFSMSRALLKAIQTLGAEKGFFVGSSFGGHLLLQILPELTSAQGLMIYGTPPLTVPLSLNEAFLGHPAGGAFFNPTPTEDEIQALANASVHSENGFALEGFVEDFKRTDPKFRAEIPTSLFNPDFRDETQHLLHTKVPIAILHGEFEKFISSGYITKLQIPTLWKNSIQYMKGCGHLLHREAPEVFTSLLNEFILHAQAQTGLTASKETLPYSKREIDSNI